MVFHRQRLLKMKTKIKHTLFNIIYYTLFFVIISEIFLRFDIFTYKSLISWIVGISLWLTIYFYYFYQDLQTDLTCEDFLHILPVSDGTFGYEVIDFGEGKSFGVIYNYNDESEKDT